VYVPNAALPTFEPVPEPAPRPERKRERKRERPAGGGFVSTGPSSGEGLIWPLAGPISSYYSAGHPLGIDIDAFNLAGAGVGAATEGTVVFAGGNACCSYGLYVVVVSPGGIETLYAHLDSISVSRASTWARDRSSAVVGSTGYSTGGTCISRSSTTACASTRSPICRSRIASPLMHVTHDHHRMPVRTGDGGGSMDSER